MNAKEMAVSPEFWNGFRLSTAKTIQGIALKNAGIWQKRKPAMSEAQKIADKFRADGSGEATVIKALRLLAAVESGGFNIGDRVRKKGEKGQWHGRIVGFYSTEITPIGYAVESERETGSVQIYPTSALEKYDE